MNQKCKNKCEEDLREIKEIERKYLLANPVRSNNRTNKILRGSPYKVTTPPLKPAATGASSSRSTTASQSCKRSAEKTIEDLEQIFRCVQLKRCRDGAKFNFTEYVALPLMMDRHEVLDFDMDQLDPDIDYDTDEHMIGRARNTLGAFCHRLEQRMSAFPPAEERASCGKYS